MVDMKPYGWDKFFEDQYTKLRTDDTNYGRIIADYGQKLRIATPEGELQAARDPHAGNRRQPAAGDWVVYRRPYSYSEPMITDVLEPKTMFSRAAAGIEVKEQVVASNIDYIFIMQSLNGNFNLRRLERYLVAAWESGAMPVVVLTKSDVCQDSEIRALQASEVARGVEIITVSALTGEGIDKLRPYLSPGKTIAFLGSSGVGKSTLLNRLAGEEVMKTGDIREDDARGRHTTTHRELVLLPNGGLVLDTPGMRTLVLWEADEGIREVFGDIEEMAASCRFSDCGHGNEPGCAVRQARENGQLSETRWISWLKLQKELRHLEKKKNDKAREERRRSVEYSVGSNAKRKEE